MYPFLFEIVVIFFYLYIFMIIIDVILIQYTCCLCNFLYIFNELLFLKPSLTLKCERERIQEGLSTRATV